MVTRTSRRSPGAVVQWLATGYLLVVAVFVPVANVLYHRFRTRPLFVAAVALLVIGSVVGALGRSFGVLLAGPLLQAGTGLLTPVGMNITLAVAPREKLGLAMGIMAAMTTLGPSLANVVSGALLAVVLAVAACRAARTARAARAAAESPEPGQAVVDLIKTDVYALSTEHNVLQALQMFTARGISGALVLHTDGSLAGFLPDGDVMRYLSAEHPSSTTIYSFATGESDDLEDALADLVSLPVMRLATPEVVTVDANASIAEAVAVLSDKHLKKVPVVHDGDVIGIVSRSAVNRLAISSYLASREVPGEAADDGMREPQLVVAPGGVWCPRRVRSYARSPERGGPSGGRRTEAAVRREPADPEGRG